MNRDELPIEPLPDAAWNRIERAVFDELDAGASAPKAAARAGLPRWAAVALAGVAAVQLLAAGAYLLTRDEGKPQPLASTRFETGREASDALLGDVTVRLEPASALLVVENASRSAVVVLERGSARFSVPQRGARPAFVVQAGDARVEVVGTQFRVTRADGSAQVETYEGVVRVIARGQTRLVARGQRWSGASATLRTGAPTTSAPPPDAPATPASPGVAASEATSAQTEPTAMQGDPRTRFERAAQLEAREPQQALRIYRGLLEEPGPWAPNALYAMARLHTELGDDARARTLLRRYLAQYPQGANAADARALLARPAR